MERVMAGMPPCRRWTPPASVPPKGRISIWRVMPPGRGAAAEGEGEGRSAAVQALDAAGIGAAEGQYLHLVGDALALGDRAEVLDELRVAYGVAVHDLERDALA